MILSSGNGSSPQALVGELTESVMAAGDVYKDKFFGVPLC